MLKIIETVIGVAVLLAGVGAIGIMYHLATQQLWHDIMRDEYEERYRRDFERRWRDQDIRIHAQLVITDEMDQGAKHEIKHHKRAV